MKPLKISTQITDRTSASIKKYFHEVTQIPLLDKREEYDIAMKVFKNGDEYAKEKLINSNLRFVVSVAKQYYSMNSNVVLDDLISVGNEGLIIAAGLFDPTRGIKFISFAVWHIRAKIIDYLNKNSRTIKTSAKIVNDERNIKLAMGDLEQKLEREPTFDELFQYQNVCATEEALEKIIIASRINVDSYDKNLSSNFSEGDYSMLDSIRNDEKESDPTFDIMSNDNRKDLIKLLDIYLPKKLRDVIVPLYGLDGSDIKTVNYLAKELDVTVHVIQTRRLQALRILKHKLKKNQINILDI